MSRIEANPTPWKIEPHQGQHGDWTAIVAPFGHIVATIPSPCWDADAKLRYPRDYENARLIVRAVNNHENLVRALEALVTKLNVVNPEGLPYVYRREVMEAQATLDSAKGEPA